jgi:acyl-CoA hydrolase
MTVDMTPRSPTASIVQMTELVLPQHTNALGTCFGGTILSWIDIAAGISARRHANRIAVTVAFDDVHFLTPIRLGDIVSVTAQVSYVGRTSMEIWIEVWRESYEGVREHSNTAYVTFVAVDQQLRPVPVPPLLLVTEEERRRFHEGERRRQDRLQRARKSP